MLSDGQLTDDELQRAFSAADQAAQGGDAQAVEDAAQFAQELQRRGLLDAGPSRVEGLALELDRENRIAGGYNTRHPRYAEAVYRIADRRAGDGQLPPEAPTRGQAFRSGVADTGTLGFMDEMTAGATGLAARAGGWPGGPDRYADSTRARVREDMAADQAEHPATYFAGQATGALGLSAAGGAVAPAAVRSAAASRPILAGAATGSVEGGIYGYGASQGGQGQRLRGGAVGLVAGAAGGAALPAAGRGLRNVISGGSQLVREGVEAARVARQEVPSLDDLFMATQAAYRAVDESGVRYSGHTTARLAGDIARAAEGININPRLHARAAAVLEEVIPEQLAGPKTLTELDQIRQLVRRDLMNSPEGADREVGRAVIEQIDNMIDNAVPQGRSQNASSLIRAARAASRQQRAAEALEEAIDSAMDRAGSTGTGGNAQNAVRQNLRRLLTNKRTSRLFNEEQQALLRRAIRGDGIQNTLRILSGLSPDRGLINMIGSAGGGALMGGPVGAVALPAIGMGARQLAEGRQGALLNALRSNVRGRVTTIE